MLLRVRMACQWEQLAALQGLTVYATPSGPSERAQLVDGLVGAKGGEAKKRRIAGDWGFVAASVVYYRLLSSQGQISAGVDRRPRMVDTWAGD